MNIRPNDLVLEVGSGHNPHMRSDVLLDLFEEDTPDQHRGGTNLTVDRPFVKADICGMPFKDKAFDYVLAIYILEHIPDVEKALKEITRVGKRGIIKLPTEFNEYLHPCNEHRWLCNMYGDTVVFKRKPRDWKPYFDNIFHWLWNNDREWFWFYQHHMPLFVFSHEWEGKIKYRVEDYSPPDFSKLKIADFTRRSSRGWKEFVPHGMQVAVGKSNLYPKIKGVFGKVSRRKKVNLEELLK
ncbi:MAG: methyltransferase domain-containing protein [Candidatus Micrarchaeota archaeon]|nr:methyltransferase domain-containing protein [Candidatus Micrarchaeota archaeon]